MLDSDLPGGHRHCYRAETTDAKDVSGQRDVPITDRAGSVSKLLGRATRKLRRLQPQHRHIDQWEDLRNALPGRVPAPNTNFDDGRVVIGQGAFGEVSVITLGSSALSQQQVTVPLDKTKLWSLLPSPSSPPALARQDSELWRIGNDLEGGPSVVAVKRFHRRPSQTASKYSRKVRREFEMARQLVHPNVIRTFDLVRASTIDTGWKSGKHGIEDDEKKDKGGDDDGDDDEETDDKDDDVGSHSALCQIMEYCDGGDVDQLIRSRAPAVLETAETDCLFQQLLAGVRYLHETAGIAHCDIKPENLLLTREGRLKIADFGCSQRCRAEADGAVVLVSAAGGSERYRAPEQHVEVELNGPAIDIWACGVTYLVMRLGRRLWPAAKADDEYYAMYLQGRREAAGYLPIEVLEPVSRGDNRRGCDW